MVTLAFGQNVYKKRNIMIFGVFTLVAVSGIIMMMIAVSKNLPTSLFTIPKGSSFQKYHPLNSTRKLPLNDILDWTIWITDIFLHRKWYFMSSKIDILKTGQMAVNWTPYLEVCLKCFFKKQSTIYPNV